MPKSQDGLECEQLHQVNFDRSRVSARNLGQIGGKRDRATEVCSKHIAGSDGEADSQDGLKCEQRGRTILVISDLHLGAGAKVRGRRNHLEDFHYDKELAEFVEYYSTGEYAERPVELIVNGDFFDLLAVPFVPFFDDEYWSEEASLEKLKMILEAHPLVLQALNQFLGRKNKWLTFIVGNHDGEFVHPSLREHLIQQFGEKERRHFKIVLEANGEYSPVPGVLLQHGHEYELAHKFDIRQCVAREMGQDGPGRSYFIPPWGSYFVTRIINKFKEERPYINAIRPIKKAMINGLIYDTLYTTRFIIASTFYFLMVRFISFFKRGKKSLRQIWDQAFAELELFLDLEDSSKRLFERRPEIGCLIVGHTHEPNFRTFADGRAFINTGTWTNMYYLDWGKGRHNPQLTYAQIDVSTERPEDLAHPLDGLDLALNVWKGINPRPFREY